MKPLPSQYHRIQLSSEFRLLWATCTRWLILAEKDLLAQSEHRSSPPRICLLFSFLYRVLWTIVCMFVFIFPFDNGIGCFFSILWSWLPLIFFWILHVSCQYWIYFYIIRCLKNKDIIVITINATLIKL